MKNLIFLASLFAALNVMAGTISQTEVWGGEGISVQVFSDQSASLRFDCASGTLPENSWQSNQSRLSATGTFRKEMGARKPGPGAMPKSEKASYAANIDVSKGTMTLSLKVGADKTIYKLVRGAPGVLKRCM